MNLTKSSAASSRDDVSHTTIPKTSKICGVCGDVARCYHFGGLCCASCKAFFRRAVVNDRYKQVHCTSYIKHLCAFAYSSSVVQSPTGCGQTSLIIHSFWTFPVSLRVRRVLPDRHYFEETLLALPTETMSGHRHGQEMVRF